MADVKWIKIATDIFDDEKILLIESLHDSYAIITCWFKLLCLAGKINNSGVFVMNDQIAYTDKMLSTIFRMKESTVTMALKVFEQFGMVKIVDGIITIPNWGKHQNLDMIESRNKRQREYMAKYREKQKLLTEYKANSKANSKANVSAPEEEGEEEVEIDKEYISIVDFLNEKAGTHYKASTPKTRAAIHARLAEGFTVDDFKTVIEKKCAEWIGTEWEKFLRPETLFGTKFESYLNVKSGKGEKNGRAENDDLTGTAIGTWL